MGSTLLQRQVALVSHGTLFLRGELALDDWCRHGVFFGSRLLFRAPAGNVLLADDFTLWLVELKKAGASRLSLHGAGNPNDGDVDSLAIAVHHPDHYQLWTVSPEAPAWRQSGTQSDDSGQACAHADTYGGSIDTYWQGPVQAGQLDVPTTQWHALAATIAADIGLPNGDHAAPNEGFYADLPAHADWARMPLFPLTPDTMPAHRLLATLEQERAAIDNDAHPKNEGSAYRQLDAAGADAADARSSRLDGWLIDVQRRCANTIATAVAPGRGPADAGPRAAPPYGGQGTMPCNTGGGGALPETATPWMTRVAFLGAWAAACLFIVAFAQAIVAFPWIAIVLALPVGLYPAYRQRKRRRRPPSPPGST